MKKNVAWELYINRWSSSAKSLIITEKVNTDIVLPTAVQSVINAQCPVKGILANTNTAGSILYKHSRPVGIAESNRRDNTGQVVATCDSLFL